MTEDRIQTLGRYQIHGELGRGGFATVYRALDPNLDREVALKVLHPMLLSDPSFTQRFRREAKALAALRHPNIITIYEVSETDGRLFLAMELVDGPSLSGFIEERGSIGWKETIDIIKPVTSGLDYAHGQGVVHRDLKPANIMIDRQRGPLITDFGLARLLSSSSGSVSMTMSGGILGTPSYIAPEVWELEAAAIPADVYALGCIVYEMLTGQLLFDGQTPVQILRAHDRGPQFTSPWPEGVPDGVEDVLKMALAHDPKNRYPSASSLWMALDDADAEARAAAERAQQASVAAQWQTDTEKAIAEGDYRVAKIMVGRWLTILPGDPAALAARDEIERKLSEASQAAVPANTSAAVDTTDVQIFQRDEINRQLAESTRTAAPADTAGEQVKPAAAQPSAWQPTPEDAAQTAAAQTTPAPVQAATRQTHSGKEARVETVPPQSPPAQTPPAPAETPSRGKFALNLSQLGPVQLGIIAAAFAAAIITNVSLYIDSLTAFLVFLAIPGIILASLFTPKMVKARPALRMIFLVISVLLAGILWFLVLIEDPELILMAFVYSALAVLLWLDRARDKKPEASATAASMPATASQAQASPADTGATPVKRAGLGRVQWGLIVATLAILPALAAADAFYELFFPVIFFGIPLLLLLSIFLPQLTKARPVMRYIFLAASLMGVAFCLLFIIDGAIEVTLMGIVYASLAVLLWLDRARDKNPNATAAAISTTPAASQAQASLADAGATQAKTARLGPVQWGLIGATLAILPALAAADTFYDLIAPLIFFGIPLLLLLSIFLPQISKARPVLRYIFLAASVLAEAFCLLFIIDGGEELTLMAIVYAALAVLLWLDRARDKKPKVQAPPPTPTSPDAT